MAKALLCRVIPGCELTRNRLPLVVQTKQLRVPLATGWFSEENRKKLIGWYLAGALSVGLSLSGPGIADAKSGVNKPSLLPKEFTTVIDIAGFLSPGQTQECANMIQEFQASMLKEGFEDDETKNSIREMQKHDCFCYMAIY